MTECGGDSSGGPVTTLPISPVGSLDPNEKVGSTGFGLPRFVAGSVATSYAVFFENKPTATAPAVDVVVNDVLQKDSLDLSTVQLGSINFGKTVITPPTVPLLSGGPFSTTVDLRPETNLLVKIQSTLDAETGLLKWTFNSLDPATGKPPDDPLARFRPPGGQGVVFFSVLSKASVPSETAVKNKASIVFDTNLPLETNEWSNLIDKTLPQSSVSSLAATQRTSAFPVKWQGTDSGSGVGSYTIYVADDSGPFTTWLSETAAIQGTFIGQPNHTYSFFSVARDNVANTEKMKTVGEATTKVILGSCATNAAPSLTIVRSGFRFSNATQRFVQTAVIRNTGSTPVAGPLSLVLDALSANAALFNRTGLTSCASPTGSPYLDALTSAGASILPGQTVTLTLEFTNPTNQPINYTTRILAGSGIR